MEKSQLNEFLIWKYLPKIFFLVIKPKSNEARDDQDGIAAFSVLSSRKILDQLAE